MIDEIPDYMLEQAECAVRAREAEWEYDLIDFFAEHVGRETMKKRENEG